MDFLVDRSRVIRYSIGNDPNPQGERWVGGIQLGIGPAFFSPIDFWSFENFERFKRATDGDAIVHNLKLMDEFWNL